MCQPANKTFFFSKKFLLLALLLFLLPSSSLRAAKNAIGIRVARNAEHLSPSEWYEKYAPSGGKNSVPSSISFAGYEAVSIGSCASGNGETIYVNAANIDNENLYTNIYIIACPVGADQDIVDIFEQLTKNWDFNVNIAKSEQAKIQRDTKRLSDITILNELLANYRASNNRYPKLESGTYEIGKSISSWPSWNKTFGSQLKTKLPTPPIGQGWGALTNLENWTNSNGEKVWPKDMYFPNNVGVDYTTDGCRQIAVSKDQNVVRWCEGDCNGCPNNAFSPASKNNLGDISNWNWPDELKDPTAIAQGVDYNNCEHIFVVKENRWSEFTTKKTDTDGKCSYTGWTPIAELDTVPETLNVAWPKDVQNPDAIALAWDIEGQRHIYAFKGNNFREYIDYNRPYVYQTNNQGLSYSLCAYFETVYSFLSGINCGEFQSSNYSPAIAKLTDQKVTIGNYFNYNITATDIDEDNLSWKIDLGCGSQSLGSSDITCAWTSNSTIYAASTSQKNIKKIYGTAPNTAETRTITITVSDGRGGTDTKFFKLDVVKSDLVITSLPPSDITIGDDYQYDVEARDPQGYYPLTYFWNGSLPDGINTLSIDETTGVIFGAPTKVDLYNNINVSVKNSNPAGSQITTQQFKINVNDFKVADIPDTEMTRDHTIKFFAKTAPEKVKKIKWSIACGSANASCAQDIVYSINELSGEITISTQNSAALYDVFKITVTATSDLNNNIKHQETFNITISDAKCGNGTQENTEQCDGADKIATSPSDSSINKQYSCDDKCKFTGGYCGDGIVQNNPNNGIGIQEYCDKNNPMCCDNINCKWSCPPYITVGPLGFYDKTTKNITDNITVRSDSNNETMVFPACRIFDAGSGTIDAKIISDGFSTAVVYVTDTSQSMQEEINDVRLALEIQMGKLHNAAKIQEMIDAKKSTFVGLVRFSTSFTFFPTHDDMQSIQSEAYKNDLIKTIQNYIAKGNTSALDGAFGKAVSMLNKIVADKKIIVFLGDGDGTDPTITTNNAKAAGIEIYGIAYAGGPDTICNWSSDNGINCWTGKYSYLDNNANAVYTTITANIIAMPTETIHITLNKETTFSAPDLPETIVKNISLNLDNISCSDVNQNIPFVVSYTGGGRIKFYNMRVNICKSCLSTE